MISTRHLARAAACAAFAAMVCIAQADVRMPGLFSDHMVLQQAQKLPVWGWADPGEPVTVSLGALSAKAVAGADGKWRVDLPKAEVSHEPQELAVAGKNTIKIEDVLIGEVWLCSGQSNMEYGVLNVKKKAEINDPEIRVFCVTKCASLTPVDDTMRVPPELVWDTNTGYWSKSPDAGSWNGFSAVGYLFGEQIQATTGNPVGLIGSYWGGTPAQAWTSLPALQGNPALGHYTSLLASMNDAQKARFPVHWADYIAAMRKWNTEVFEPYGVASRKWEQDSKAALAAGTPVPPKPDAPTGRPNRPGNEGTPTTLFNGMINPLIPYAIRGVIWYQGESNSYDGVGYGTLFPALIGDWRQRWGQGDLPFLFVQVANYAPGDTDPTHGRWAWLREGQAKALALPNTGMAVAIDIGNPKDIHPKDKAGVAKRLALAAQHVAYGKNLVYSGPMFASLKIDGAKARVSFTSIGAGLVAANSPLAPTAVAPSPDPIGFEVAGDDHKWYPAKAVIDGDSIVVTADGVPVPVAVRYAWADNPTCNLYNKDGLPAAPFRTDNWK